MDPLRLISALTAFLALAHTDVSAIHCFQCNSYVDKGCDSLNANDTFSPYYKPCNETLESNGRELFCRKTVQLILDTDFEHTRIIRSCGWVRHPKYDCYDFKNKGHEDVSCTCYHDGCNSAPFGAPTTASVFGLAVFSCLRYLR